MRKKPFTTALLAFLLLSGTACENSSKTTEGSDDAAAMAESMTEISKAEKLRTDMRKLWEDHVCWTRNVIFCLVDDLPGSDQAVERLMKNQNDIGDAVGSYYGNDAGKKLTDLLHEHIAGAAEVVKAARADDKVALKAASEKWDKNADEISEFLCSANPNWDLKDMKSMMNDHLKLTTDEAVARIKKDYKADIKAYDKVHDEILMMADMLSEGIIKQYPDKFKD